MQLVDEKPIPPAPRGYRASIKLQWVDMAKAMQRQGIDPAVRLDLLTAYIRVVGEEADLDGEWTDANLSTKLAIGRRFSTILSEKLRLRKLLLAPAGEP
jgi:hypothetical protein